MPIAQYLLLLAITTIAGGLSAFMWWMPNGFMAAAMAFCYSLGTIRLAEKERRAPGSVGLPDALVTGLITGTIAAIPVLFLETLRPPRVNWHQEFLASPELDCWYLISGCILLGMALHYSYYRRKGAAKPFKRVLWTAFALFALVKVALALTAWGPGDLELNWMLPIQLTLGGIIGFLWFVAPFPFMWVWATSSLDPAWDVEPEGQSSEGVSEEELTTH